MRRKTKRQGKILAWSDPERRLSKRAKDQTDLFRIAEHYPDMINLLPEKLKAEIIEDQVARLHRTEQDITHIPRSQGERKAPLHQYPLLRRYRL